MDSQSPLVVRCSSEAYGLFLRVSASEAAELQRIHAEAYARQVAQLRPLPSAKELLAHLTKNSVPWAIATSSWLDSARPSLRLLGVAAEGHVSFIPERGAHAGPSPEEMQTFIVHSTRITVPTFISHPAQLYDHFIRYQEPSGTLSASPGTRTNGAAAMNSVAVFSIYKNQMP